MIPLFAITKRELHSFFVSPIAYVLLTVWLFVQGLTLFILATWYANNPGVTDASSGPLTSFFGGTSLYYIVLIVLSPILTMRLVAEEKRTGTIETLMTAPVSDVAFVLGKYVAALALWVALWLPTLLYVWILSHYGSVDPGLVASSYLGIFGTGLYYMAIGLLMSTVSKNQIVAATLTFLVLGMLFLTGVMDMVVDDEVSKSIFSYVSIWGHMTDFARGIVDSRRLVFDVSLAVLALAMTLRVVESRRYEV